jgi:regulator of RNase E activity RraA
LVVVPYQNAEEIVKLAEIQQNQEEEILHAIDRGEVDRRWVDEILKRKGCEGMDEERPMPH